jgi:lipopolysaccharide export system protein LptA
MQDVDLVVGDDALAVHLAGAWVGPDGSGHGTETRAEAPGPPPLVVTGGRSEWKLADGVVVFEQAVTATRHDVTITCDRLEVRYSGDRVEEATATGHVRVARGARAATGERATLTVADGRVVLEGSPTLTEGPNRMTGERIVLWLDDERLECDRCRLEVRGDAVAPGAPPR